MWRLLSSEHLTVTRRELLEEWSIEDAWDAHAVLDAIETSKIKALPKAPGR